MGDIVFDRLRKIFNLPNAPVQCKMIDDDVSTPVSSADYYKERGTPIAYVSYVYIEGVN